MKTKYIISICFVLIVIAFFAGRATVSTKTKIEYIKGEEVTGSVPTVQFVPVRESIPNIPVLPFRPIFIKDVQYIVPDTAAIIADYEKRREYSLVAFDDKEKGRLELFPTIQYNALQSLDWKYIPIHKVVTQTKEKLFQPFVSAGWSTLNYLSVGGGMFYHNFGVEYQYLKGYKGVGDGHMVGAKWKF